MSVRVVATLAAFACLTLAGCTSSTSGTGDDSSADSSAGATTSSVPGVTADPIPAPITSPAVPSSPSSSGASSSTPLSGATVTTVVRPVTSAGTPAPGWHATTQDLTITCAPASPSPVSITAGVAFCSPSAASALACWPSPGAHALCLADVESKALNRFPVAGAFPLPPAAADPGPLSLELTDGSTCDYRDGGTGARLDANPSWVIYYYCSGNQAAFAPPDSSAVDTGDPLWTVAVASADGTGAVRTVGVVAATFVGTAGG